MGERDATCNRLHRLTGFAKVTQGPILSRPITHYHTRNAWCFLGGRWFLNVCISETFEWFHSIWFIHRYFFSVFAHDFLCVDLGHPLTVFFLLFQSSERFLCCWSDLQNFGSRFVKSQFNPLVLTTLENQISGLYQLSQWPWRGTCIIWIWSWPPWRGVLCQVWRPEPQLLMLSLWPQLLFFK